MKNSKSKLLKQTKSVDRNLFLLILAFLVIGLIAVADVSAPESLSTFGDKFFLLKQQIQWAVIGVIILGITSKIKYTVWEKVATPLFLFALILLVAVLIPHVSFSALGARRWISVGPINFQPSEIVKFAIVMYLAKVASKGKKIISYIVPIAITAVLIMLEPDLGTTLIIAGIAFAQVFVSDVNLWHVFGSFILAGLTAIPLILFSPYRRERLLTFFQMERDPLSSSYHIKQVLLALGSGGIFGVGLGASRQKYLFLPEAANDSIFAVISEELGFIGAVFIIGMFIYFAIKGFSIARRAPDVFSKVLATGITSWILIQAILNIGSMVAIVPLTGIPLPFISYGGSSLVMILAACGILLNISKYVTHQAK
jgi:cell division protein FtsW